MRQNPLALVEITPLQGSLHRHTIFMRCAASAPGVIGCAASTPRAGGCLLRDRVGSFRRPVCDRPGERNAQPEQRNHAIGLTQNLALAVVVFVGRSESGVEIIRIISARKAEEYEQRPYEDQFE